MEVTSQYRSGERDQELWVVHGEGFSIPITCEPFTADGKKTTHWLVTPPFQMLAGPFEELAVRLSPLNQIERRDCWLIPERSLSTVAEKATGMNPKFYFKWGKESETRQAMSIDKVDERNPSKFMDFVCRRSGIDKNIGYFVWAAIKEGMLHWFINGQKSIDFELFKVHPIPFRVNWKEIMLAKFPTAWNTIFKHAKGTWKDKAIQTGFMDALGSTDNIRMEKPGCVVWTLEVQVDKLWIESVTKAESDRLHWKRPAKYAKYYEDCLRRRLDSILDTFESWLSQGKTATGRLVESPATGHLVLRPERRNIEVLRTRAGRPTITLEPFDGPKLTRGDRYPRPLPEAIKEVLAVPHNQPTPVDMRGCDFGSVVDESQDKPNGVSGVPLLPPNEGQVIECEVLDGGQPGGGADSVGGQDNP